MNFRRPFSSIATNLAFWFCLSSIVLTILLSQVIEQVAMTLLRIQISEKLGDLAYQATDKLDQGMFERYREVQLMASRKSITDPAVPLAVKQALVDQIYDSYRYYAWIGIADLQGRVLVSAKGILTGADASARPWFINALNGSNNVGDLHEAKMLAKILPPPASGEPLRFIDVAFPYVDNDGKVAGVLGAHLSWEWARTVEQSVITPAARRSRIDALIIANDGKVLLGPKGLQGTTLDLASLGASTMANNHSAPTHFGDQREYLVGISKSQGRPPFPGFGWTVLVRQDAEEALATVRAMQRRVLWSGFSIALLFSLFGVYNARRVSRPLRRLAADVRDYRRGSRPTLKASDGSYREIDELSTSFVALVDDLQRNEDALRNLNASLESRVSQRTAELAKSEARLRAITDNLPVLISYIDRHQCFQFANATFKPWLGVAPAAVIGMHMRDLLGAQLYEQRLPMVERALNGEQVVFEMASRALDTDRYLHTTYVPDIDAAGVVDGFYTLTSDVSEIKHAEQEMTRLARHDSLTGLPNRYQLDEKLDEAVRRCRRSGMSMAVMFLDIDYFKRINDSLGHAAGDEVLKQFGDRLKACVRVTDTVARLAGDEFIVLLEGLHVASEAHAVARKILASQTAEINLAGRPLYITTSIGIAFTDGSNLIPTELMAHADRALYAAKAGGRNAYVCTRLCAQAEEPVITPALTASEPNG